MYTITWLHHISLCHSSRIDMLCIFLWSPNCCICERFDSLHKKQAWQGDTISRSECRSDNAAVHRNYWITGFDCYHPELQLCLLPSACLVTLHAHIYFFVLTDLFDFVSSRVPESLSPWRTAAALICCADFLEPTLVLYNACWSSVKTSVFSYSVGLLFVC